MNHEAWRPIPEAGGLYEASDYGRIRCHRASEASRRSSRVAA